MTLIENGFLLAASWVWIEKMDVHRTLMGGHEIEPASGGETRSLHPQIS